MGRNNPKSPGLRAAQSYTDLLPPELPGPSSARKLPEPGIALPCPELACVCQDGAAAALGMGACW